MRSKISFRYFGQFIEFLRLSTLWRQWRLFLLIALVACAAAIYHLTDFKYYLQPGSIATVREQILAFGWKGMAAFLLIYIIVITLALPNLPFQLAAAAIYGLWPAFALMYLGVNIGALTAFTFARALGRSGIESLWGHRIKNLNVRIEQGGFRIILILRLIPLMPFNAINYAAGVSRVRLAHYLPANLLGMLPLTFVHVVFGDAMGTLDLTKMESWAHPQVYAPILVATVMFVIGLAWGYRARK